jgi:hypothetical protein
VYLKLEKSIMHKTFVPNNRPFAHAPNVLELTDGSIFVLWYCGAYEGAEDQRVNGYILRTDGTETEPFVLIDQLVFEDQMWYPETAVPIQLDDGSITLFFFAFPATNFKLNDDLRCDFLQPLHTGFSCTPRRFTQPIWYRHLMNTRLFYSRLEDFSLTEIVPFPIEHKAMVFQGRALHLNTGEWVLPYHRRIGVEMRAAQINAGFVIGNPELTRWEFGAEMFVEPGCSEPTVVQLPNGEVLTYMRRPGLTRTPPPPPGHIWRAVSADGCRSFTEPVQTNLRNPDTGSDLFVGQSGSLVVAFNDSYTQRCPLTVGLSDDLGETFRMKDIESTLGVYAYPKLLQTRDGMWHLFYSYNYTQIAQVTFDEEWLADGRVVLA